MKNGLMGTSLGFCAKDFGLLLWVRDGMWMKTIKNREQKLKIQIAYFTPNGELNAWTSEIVNDTLA